MIVELDRNGLLSLVNGTEPGYGAFEHPLIKKCGVYMGGLGDHWEWFDLEDLTDEELFEIYNICQDETINIQREIEIDEFPITEEQRANMPDFRFMEDRLNWEMKTSINNHIIGSLIKGNKQNKEVKTVINEI